MIDKDQIKKVADEWEKEMLLLDNSNKVDFSKDHCDLKVSCDSREYAFRVISGAANVIGPRVCWAGKDILRSKVKNSNVLNSEKSLIICIFLILEFKLKIFNLNFLFF